MRLERDGFSIDSAIRKGRKLPDWYLNEPTLLPIEQFYLRAFNELVTGRNQDGRISWRDIEDYAARWGIDDDLFPVFREVIRALERVFAEWLESERERKRSKEPDRQRTSE